MQRTTHPFHGNTRPLLVIRSLISSYYGLLCVLGTRLSIRLTERALFAIVF